MPIDTCLCRGSDADCPLCFGRGTVVYDADEASDDDRRYLAANTAGWAGEGIGEFVVEAFEFVFEALGEILGDL